MCNCICYESEFVIQRLIFWWFLQPLIDDKMAFAMRFLRWSCPNWTYAGVKNVFGFN